MKHSKLVLTFLFLSTLLITSCSSVSTSEDGLYENEQQSVDLTKGHRPGDGAGTGTNGG